MATVRAAPADWVAIDRVKNGQPVGRSLFTSEKLELLEWSVRAGVTDKELARRVIQPNGKRLSHDAVSQWRRRHRNKLSPAAQSSVGITPAWEVDG